MLRDAQVISHRHSTYQDHHVMLQPPSLSRSITTNLAPLCAAAVNYPQMWTISNEHHHPHHDFINEQSDEQGYQGHNKEQEMQHIQPNRQLIADVHVPTDEQLSADADMNTLMHDTATLGSNFIDHASPADTATDAVAYDTPSVAVGIVDDRQCGHQNQRQHLSQRDVSDKKPEVRIVLVDATAGEAEDMDMEQGEHVQSLVNGLQLQPVSQKPPPGQPLPMAADTAVLMSCDPEPTKYLDVEHNTGVGNALSQHDMACDVNNINNTDIAPTLSSDQPSARPDWKPLTTPMKHGTVARDKQFPITGGANQLPPVVSSKQSVDAGPSLLHFGDRSTDQSNKGVEGSEPDMLLGMPNGDNEHMHQSLLNGHMHQSLHANKDQDSQPPGTPEVPLGQGQEVEHSKLLKEAENTHLPASAGGHDHDCNASLNASLRYMDPNPMQDPFGNMHATAPGIGDHRPSPLADEHNMPQPPLLVDVHDMLQPSWVSAGTQRQMQCTKHTPATLSRWRTAPEAAFSSLQDGLLHGMHGEEPAMQRPPPPGFGFHGSHPGFCRSEEAIVDVGSHAEWLWQQQQQHDTLATAIGASAWQLWLEVSAGKALQGEHPDMDYPSLLSKPQVRYMDTCAGYMYYVSLRAPNGKCQLAATLGLGYFLLI